MEYLLILLVLVSVACALGYGVVFTRQEPSFARSTVKTLSIASLAGLSFIAAGPVLLTTGLVLGALGDFFLSLNKDKGFLPGLAAFLAGHVCFVALFFQFGLGLEVLLAEIWRVAGVFIIISLAVVMTRFLWPYLGKLSLPVLAYIFAIVAMGVGAFTQPLNWAQWLAIPGAILFMASDAILSLELFFMEDANPTRAITAPVLWFLYWVAQVLIAGAFLL